MSVDNLQQTCRQQAVASYAKTHPDVGLLLTSLFQDFNNLCVFSWVNQTYTHNLFQFSPAEAGKVASVSKIQFEQKIMEKESLKKMSEIEGSCLKLYKWSLNKITYILS